jgi:P4 family phage/plasmid primase-like protien
MTLPADVLVQARRYSLQNFSVIPIRLDGSKAPALPPGGLEERFNTPADDATLQRWFSKLHGIGLITGEVSGDLLVFDLEGRFVQNSAQYNEWCAEVERDIPGLFARTPVVETPTGGRHIYVKAALGTAPHSEKLAELAKPGPDGKTCLIELKAYHGYVVAPGSPAAVHALGVPYKLVSGDFGRCYELTEAQQTALFDICNSYDQRPPKEVFRPPAPRTAANGNLRPGDDYDRRVGVDRDMIRQEGWTFVSKSGGMERYRRPGGSRNIASATILPATSEYAERLYVHSTNAPPFEGGKAYTGFAIFAMFKHASNFEDAARALGAKGFGRQQSKQSRTEPPVVEESTTASARQSWFGTRTEEGNARRFFSQWRKALRYCALWSAWLVWDGTRWARDRDKTTERYARQTAASIYEESAAAAKEGRTDDSNALATWAVKSGTSGAVDAMLKLSRSEKEWSRVPEDFDQHPMLLNVRNGTIDLTTGELRPHRREDYLTKVAPVDFDPEAKAPIFERFLRDVFETDELIADVQRVAGYSITGNVSGRIMPICWGSGRNGKNTFLEAIRNVLGEDYSASIDPEILLVSRDRTPLHELAALDGIRFAVTEEIQEGRRLAEALVKRLTGSEWIHACRKYEHPYDFRVQFKIWMLTNFKPVIKDHSHAMWDRLRLIPFEKRFYMADDEDVPEGAMIADTTLAEQLRVEASGILNWLIEGCLAWQKNGLPMSEKVRNASRKYRVDSDAIGRFIEERCVVGEDYRVQSSLLLKTFNDWSGENLSSPRFRPLMVARGYKFTTSGVVWVHGLTLKPEFLGT